MTPLAHPCIDEFLDSLWLEKGLSPHSRDAYRSDLELFHAWLQARGLDLPGAGREIILDHLGWTHFFAHIYALDLFSPRLPNKAAMIARLLADQNIPKNQAVYIGDRTALHRRYLGLRQSEV